MKSIKKILLCAAASGFFASSLSAQEWVFEDVTVPVGSTTASVDWTYTGGAGSSQNSVDIPASVGILTGVDLSNCIITEGADTASCLNNAGTIRITMLNFDAANELGNASGTLVFDVDPAAIDGDSQDVIATAVPGGFDIAPTITNGSVSIAAVSAVLNVTPPTISFGNQQQATTSAPQPVTISNDGTDGIDLEVSAINVTGDFAVAGGGTCGAVPFTLTDGSSCTQNVEFTPTALGARTGTLTVVSDAGITTNDAVDLDGEGTAGPVAVFLIDPATAAFGTVDLGDMPQSIVHTVENDGDAGSTLELNSVVYTGDAEFSISSTTCGATLAADETCTVTVTFDAAANGNYTGSVDVETNVGNFSVPVTGEAASVAVLSVNPPFGPVDLGSGPPGSTQTANGSISNTGSADGDFTCALGGPDAAVFSTNPSPLSGTVTAGGDVAFSLSCALPTAAAEGDIFNATLTCSSPDDATFAGTHELSCSVLSVPVIPVNTLQPWALILFSMLMLAVGGLSIRFVRAS